MRAPIVLVAFANQSGSTAGIAEAIAAELRLAGVQADCRTASEVETVDPYDAVVLGSGVFIRSRASDGGGFLARHATALAGRRTWLFCAGPIGRARSAVDGSAAECAVVDVARSIGARGAAAFGCVGPDPSLDAFDLVPPVDMARVRAWAREIAADLAVGRSLAAAS